MPFSRSLEYYRRRFHEKQLAAWLAYKAGKTLVLPAGRRSGKSQVFTEIMVEEVEEFGQDCLYVAKTQKQARRIVWKKFAEILRDQDGWKLNGSRLEAVYRGGALISVKGADLSTDNLAGSAYRVIVCDEYALWRNPDIVKEILAPMIVDYNGQLMYGSTKRGKNHFYTLHQQALANPKKYYVSEFTMFDNKFLSDEGRDKVISEYSGKDDPLYKQEILNEYVSFEGMAFALEESVYVEKRWDPADLEHSFHWRGVDHGYSPDPTACVWVAYNRRKGYFQVYSDYEEKQLLIKTHTDAILNQEPYQVIDTFSDIDPQVMAEYEEVGLAMVPARKTDKDARILRLVNHMRTGRLKIASCCTKILTQLQSYEWGQDGNDHLVDSFNYSYNNIVVPPENTKKKDTLPKHVYKSKDGENNQQTFGNGDSISADNYNQDQYSEYNDDDD